MWTVQQKAEFVLWHAELKSAVKVQRKWLRLHPGEKAPDDKALNRWLKQFKETGSAVKQKYSGRFCQLNAEKKKLMMMKLLYARFVSQTRRLFILTGALTGI
jgi:hypothetical protein